MNHIAKVFMTGRSQAVRLPKSLRFKGKKVVAKRFGNGVLLLPEDNTFKLLQEAASEFEPDFILEREQPAHQQRGDFL